MPGSRRAFLVAILLLALAHGGLYANLLPPWGLIDEEQHVHYVQALAEEGAIPVVGQTTLSPEIIESVFAAHRWETFHWHTPPGRTPQEMGLEGFSYEGYHPPLYYALLAPLFAALPLDILSKVFVLRWATVLLSLATAWLIYRTCRALCPDEPLLPFLAALLLVALPERTAAVSRVNNDALLEVIAAAFVWLCTVALLHGVTLRRSLLMGLLFGLGLLTKTSMAILIPLPLTVFWVHRRTRGIWRWAAWTALIVAALVLPFYARNLLLYGDPTGMAAFKQITNFAAPPADVGTLAHAILDLFRNQWLIWWKGGQPGSNPAITGIILFLAFSWGVALFGLARLKKTLTAGDPRPRVLAAYAFTIGLCALAVLRSYFAGDFPVIQGRFFLPVIVPLVLLWAWGLWRAPLGRFLLAATVIVLLAADALNLFGNLMPYFYFWSAFIKDGAPQPFIWPGLAAAWRTLLTRALADKPAGWATVLTTSVMAYAVALTVVALRFARIVRPVVRRPPRASDFSVSPSSIPSPGQTSGSRQSPPELQPASVHSYHPTRDPLLWTVGGLLVFYLVWIAMRPQGVFWSLDEGGKFLYLQNTLATRDISAPLAYPGRRLDPEYENVPLYFFAPRGNDIYSWWPIGFPLLTLPLYKLFGWFGLYLLPATSGAASALLAGLLVRQALRGDNSSQISAGWLGASAALIVGIATPVAFYSTLFWEHTLATALLLGAVSSVLHGLRRQQTRWLILAGALGAAAAFLRPEVVGLLVGGGVVLLFLRWRVALQFGAAFIAGCLPWILFNLHFMGGILGRQWEQGPQSLQGSLFSGLIQTGKLFVPYLLFNVPLIGAYALPAWALYMGAGLVALACLLPLISRLRPAVLLVYVALLALTGWVLLAPEQYRSVHGFVLVAPHIVFAAWLYATRTAWRRAPFRALLLGATAIFLAALLARGWLAAGGLQWGPRYMLPLYPLLVVAAIAGMARIWGGLGKRLRAGILCLYLIAAIIGAGFALRGMVSAARTVRYYQQTQVAMRQRDPGVVVTRCTWMPMVIPELYWTGDIFIARSKEQLADWGARAQAASIGSAQFLDLDICNTDGLEVVAGRRATNPSGLSFRPIDLTGMR